jgi:hypothetical protein
MFGTDLDFAYAEGSVAPADPVLSPGSKSEPKQSPPPTYSPEIPTIDTVVPPVIPTLDTVSYEQSERIRSLERQLEESKQQSHGDSLYDRYASKKKDVMKLLAISLTVLLAISAHHVFADFLRSYLHHNTFSNGHEALIKLGYPTTVLFVLWSLKAMGSKS